MPPQSVLPSQAFLLHGIIILGIILCTACMFDSAPMIDMAMNADTLLPFSFMWDATTHAYGWQGHQLPRIPSLIPDMMVLGTVWLGTESARWTLLLYGVIQLLALVYASGWIVARLSRRPFAAGVSVMFVLVAMLVLLQLGTGKASVILYAFLPANHFGPFLFSLPGAWFAAAQLREPSGRQACWLAGISGLVFLSDKLLLIEFILPLVSACAVMWGLGYLPLARLSRVTMPIGAGLCAGWLGFRLLRYSGLNFEAAPALDWAGMIQASRHFVGHLPALARARSTELSIGFIAPSIMFLIFPWLLVQRWQVQIPSVRVEPDHIRKYSCGCLRLRASLEACCLPL